MTLKPFIFLILFLSFIASAGLKDQCLKLFRSSFNSANFQRLSKEDWKNSYARGLYFSVYKQMPLLKDLFSEKEIAGYEASLEDFLTRLEDSYSVSIAAQSRLKILDPALFKALEAFPEIVRFAVSPQALHYDLNAKLIVEAVIVSFEKHTEAYLTHHEADKLDWPRINEILKRIAEFKSRPGAFALYKINRAIREKYSLREYINCKRH